MTERQDCNPLLLDNQLCFPLYASARKIVAAYHPFLKKLGLTYSQYVTMMVLWEEKNITMHELGRRLYLDSGTLTPVLKKLEKASYVTRARMEEDERVVVLDVTEKGMALERQALSVPEAMRCLINQKGPLFTPEELDTLKKQLYRLIDALEG